MKLISRDTAGMRWIGRIARGALMTVALGAGVVAALSTLPARASAQTSHSSAAVTDNASNGSDSCNNVTGFGGLASVASCTHVPVTPIPITGGTGSAFSSSTNSTRTVTASTTLAQTGAANSMNALTQALSTQNSSISVTGTPGSTDNLVFHFITPIAQGMGAGGTSSSSALWELILNAGTFSGTEYKYAYGNGTSDPTTTYTNASAAAGGVDFIVPFSAFGNVSTLGYVFEPFVQANINGNQPSGTTLDASLTATLEGVDAETAQGRYIASTIFNADNGTGTLNLTTTTTTPEPSSVALFGSGLIGLMPVARRRRKSLA